MKVESRATPDIRKYYPFVPKFEWEQNIIHMDEKE
jgi:hypothetical protein